MIRARMGRCEACGAYATDYTRPENIPAEAKTVRSLDVHHLDEDPGNNNVDNLMALCHACHQRVHGNEPTVSDREHHRGGARAQDSVKPPLDWEGLPLGEQARLVRGQLVRGQLVRAERRGQPAASAGATDAQAALDDLPPMAREFFRHVREPTPIVTPPPPKRRQRAATRRRSRPSRTGRAAVSAYWSKRQTPEARAASEQFNQRWLADQQRSNFLVSVLVWSLVGGGAYFVVAVLYSFAALFAGW